MGMAVPIRLGDRVRDFVMNPAPAQWKTRDQLFDELCGEINDLYEENIRLRTQLAALKKEGE